MSPNLLAVFSLILPIFFKKSLPYFKKYLPDNPNQRSAHKIANQEEEVLFLFLWEYILLLSGNIIPIYCIPFLL